MAYYALINNENMVTKVISGISENNMAELPSGFSSWEEYYLSRNPDSTLCKRTSFNTKANEHLLGGDPFRGNFAGIGYTYDIDNDVFIPPNPTDENDTEFEGTFVLNTSTWVWDIESP